VGTGLSVTQATTGYVTAANFTGGAFAGTTMSGATFTASSGLAATGYVTAANFTGGTYVGSVGFSTPSGYMTATNFTGSAFTGSTSVYGATVSAGSGGVSSVGDVVAYASDDRLKNRLENIQGALEKVKALNGFQYRWNDLAQGMGMDDNVHIGLSAQEVQKVLPEVIRPSPINNEYLTIQYEKLVPLLIEAIKELCRTIQ
jgi:hypothetical protein